jgi:transcriptional regulator with XRE-family HTH domain
MKHDSVTGIEPEILRWARKSVGLTVTDVADMLKRHPEEIEAWEDGRAAPTYPQLEKLAYQIYKRPLAIFFLPSPPEEALPQREFRTLPVADMQPWRAIPTCTSAAPTPTRLDCRSCSTDTTPPSAISEGHAFAIAKRSHASSSHSRLPGHLARSADGLL